ncbi:MAG: hypothetical protein M1827_005626 [Pycnora praestabilis]|nr:MAG: hypothetical protein M1827_005626 [Pycnora praestabilis]
MLSPSTPPKSSHRQSSISNSTSSSSIVTVQRASSLSSRSGSRTQVLPRRSQTPDEIIGAAPNQLRSPDRKRHSSAAYSPSSVVNGIKEGVGNLNRWSQSTTSSVSSNGPNRRSSFSKRLSFGGSSSFGSNPFGSFGSLTYSQSPPKNPVSKVKSSIDPNPSRQAPSATATAQRYTPITTLPPIVPLPSLTQAVDASNSPSTVASITPSTAEPPTPSTFSSINPDYFGERWQKQSPPKKRPSASRTKTAPLPAGPVPSTSRIAASAGYVPLRPTSSSGPILPTHSGRGPSRSRYKEKEQDPGGGHPRLRRDIGKGSTPVDAYTLGPSSRNRDRDQERGDRDSSQKAMLSAALQKANTAVLLDNAQNFVAAMDAYADACALLEQVMSKSSGDDDRRKLEAIRSTYTNRIAELRTIDPQWQGADSKALPARPESNELQNPNPQKLSVNDDDEEDLEDDDEDDDAIIETATIHSYVTEHKQSRIIEPSQVPPRGQSLLPSALDGKDSAMSSSLSNIPIQAQVIKTTLNLAPPMDRDYMPPPLSPRRPHSPAVFEPKSTNTVLESDPFVDASPVESKDHLRGKSSESTSWLNTIDESGSSSASSVHSRSSSIALRRKHIRVASGDTQAEFDAALDAAVEAAYDDGYEPEEELDDPAGFRIVSEARKNVELAKENIRLMEREDAIRLASEKEKQRLQKDVFSRSRSDSVDLEYDDSEAEEEERMLEEMTRGYVMDDFEFDLQSKSALPRTSDSSGFSGRTYGSSIGSNPATAGTSLQTVAEALELPSLVLPHAKTPPPHPPPSIALPPPPTSGLSSAPPPPPTSAPPPRPPSLIGTQSQSVRDRRLSGQNTKQLKIETSGMTPPISQPPLTQLPTIPSALLPKHEFSDAPPKSASAIPQARELTLGTSTHASKIAASSQNVNRAVSTPLTDSSPADILPSMSPATSALMTAISQDSENSWAPPRSASPGRLFGKNLVGPGTLKKNFSSSNLKNRNLSVSSPDDAGSDGSIGTPLTTTFSAGYQSRMGPPLSTPALQTSSTATFTANGLPTGGLYLFDSDIHSPTSPGSPNPLAANAPIPLEPCPDAFLLRPFWLMRCFYQTLAHPRGGYISTKLFVPRDVWRVKNVKIKGLEEKISNCDLLTAALLKLGKVDTCDADAVLDEMQSLELVLDQVQVSLTKKVGNEVGIQGPSSLFKDSAIGGEAGSNVEALTSKSTNTSGKYLASWRRLRNKGSGPILTQSHTVSNTRKEASKEVPSMSTLPMTSLPNPRFAKRDMSRVIQFPGPNANYMGALARLCDAVQVLDQIARQVEDPGLKHSSQTHVGLELSTRHAAEFFGFYVCRFVLTDITMMLEKFIKRGSEWVLV